MAVNEIEKQPSPHKEKTIASVRRHLRNEVAVLAFVLTGLIIVSSFVTGHLSTRPKNVVNILLQSSVRGVASIGQTFCILSGNFDISIGGIGLFCSLLGAQMMTMVPEFGITSQPVSWPLVIPVMLLTGLAWGALNGMLISRIGMPPIVVTLGMWLITRGSAFQLSAGYVIFNLDPGFSFIGSGTISGVPVPVVIWIVTIIITYFVLTYTTYGPSVYASGGNPAHALLSGINVKNITLSTLMISGFCAALAGVIVTSRVMSASMGSLSGLEIDTFAACFVGGISISGGKGNLIGVILGVLIIGVLRNTMSILGANPTIVDIVTGSIIVLAVAIDYLRRRGT